MIATFDPVGIGQTLTIIVAAIGVLTFAAWFFFFRDGLDDYEAYELDGSSGRRGVLLAQYLNVDDLTSIAAQQGVVPNPAWIERGQNSRASVEASAGAGRAGYERGREAREHVDLPRQPVDLVPKLIQRLKDTGTLHLTLANAPMQVPDVRSAVSDVDAATEYALGEINQRYPDGIDEPFDTVIREVVDALNRKAHEDEISQKRAEFQAVGNDAFVLIESVWRVRLTGDVVQLWLTDWEWVPNAPYEQDHERSLPQGIQVKVEFPRRDLTERGQRDLGQDGEKRRLGVLGTTERYVTGAGRLEILPIAIFARVGRTGGAPWTPRDGQEMFPC